MEGPQDLLDVVPIPDGPCVVVWRRHAGVGKDVAFEMLLQAMVARNPEAVLVILGGVDGFDILDETDMARLGWVRSCHPSCG